SPTGLSRGSERSAISRSTPLPLPSSPRSRRRADAVWRASRGGRGGGVRGRGGGAVYVSSLACARDKVPRRKAVGTGLVPHGLVPWGHTISDQQEHPPPPFPLPPLRGGRGWGERGFLFFPSDFSPPRDKPVGSARSRTPSLLLLPMYE
ncbi:MAG: hypothetical protein NTV79_06655, partial [Candidatus Aureabacteria bacterium]|nr:hypothetical protein [Candidatus Auribacterota bacterium]